MNSIFPIFLVFVFFVGLMLIAGNMYSRFFDLNNRRVKSSIKKFQSLSKNASSQSNVLLKDDVKSSDIIEALKNMNLPVVNRLELLIVRSGINKNLQYILTYCLIGFIAGFSICQMTSFPLLLSVVVSLAVAFSPILYLKRMMLKRTQAFTKQFPDALDHITRSIKTGQGLISSIGLVATDLSEPVSLEFRQVFDEVNFGLDFNQSLSNLAMRVPSSDLNFFVIALLIQRESGGNLTELLGNLSATMRERVKLHGKIQTLSAEGRFSAYLLAILPFIIGLLFYFLNPDYMSLLWLTNEGKTMLVVGLILMFFGYIWLMRIVKIEI